MVDLVSISFAKALGLSPCTKSRHHHVVPVLEGIGETCPKTYGFFHLRMTITQSFHAYIYIHKVKYTYAYIHTYEYE